MNKPSPTVWLLASPPAFFGTWGVMLLLLYQWTQNPAVWPVVLIVGVVLAGIMRADEQVRRYKEWQRDWQAMGGETSSAKSGMPLGVAITLLLILGVAFGQNLPPATQNGLVLLVALGGGGWAAIRWFARRPVRLTRHKPVRIAPVAIVVSRPIYPVPSLAEAYALLPDHCQRLA